VLNDWPSARKGKSLYEYVSEHLAPDGTLSPEGTSLPDEGRVMTGELKWAPGAMEGSFGHHAGAGDDSDGRTDLVADRLGAAAKRQSKGNLVRLYGVVCDDDVLSIIDRVVATGSPGRAVVPSVAAGRPFPSRLPRLAGSPASSTRRDPHWCIRCSWRRSELATTRCP
jgi:hypothetical protein